MAATYDGATLWLFVNGTQVSSQARTGSIVTSTNPLQIGGDSIYGPGLQRHDRRGPRLQRRAQPGPDSGGHDDCGERQLACPESEPLEPRLRQPGGRVDQRPASRDT